MTWWSLCCGLDAVASWAMARRRPPVSRMGGKRAYSDDVLRIIGEHPKTWHMVDADPAIVLWWSAVFGGWLDEVADRIRAYDLDGEELWRSIVYANGKDGKDGPAQVPVDPVERLAAWLIAQKGNFSAKPLGWNSSAFTGDQRWQGAAGFNQWDASRPRQGNWATFKAIETEKIADKVAAWQGVAGYGPGGGNDPRRSPSRAETSDKVAAWQGPRLAAAATFADLNTWAPDFQPGDLVTIDPPYSGTTGYGEALPRDRVVELALMADTAGACVLVHEAEAVIEPGAASWRLEALHPNICAPEHWRSLGLRKGERKNQDTWRKRGKHGAREVVTINFEPAGRLGLQGELFKEHEP